MQGCNIPILTTTQCANQPVIIGSALATRVRILTLKDVLSSMVEITFLYPVRQIIHIYFIVYIVLHTVMIEMKERPLFSTFAFVFTSCIFNCNVR